MGKKSSPPPAPDYSALAIQQAALNKTAAQEQTAVNRPNQVTPWGTTQWSRGPGTFDQAGYDAALAKAKAGSGGTPGRWEEFNNESMGQGRNWIEGTPATQPGTSPNRADFQTDGDWTQTQTLNPQDQALLDQYRQFQGKQQTVGAGLLDKAQGSLGREVDYGATPTPQGIDMSKMDTLDAGFGAVEGVRDAMMGRMAPQRAQQRQSEIQRLKNQGLTEDSDAFQRAMTRLDQGDTDANQQALLGATSAYGDIFNRGLQKNNQNFGQQDAASRLAGLLRQQNLSEQETQRQSPLNDYMKLVQGTDPSAPQMPSFMGGTGYNAADMTGAAQSQYQAQMDAFNADQAQKGGMMSGLFGLGGAMLGGPAGSFGGKLAGKLFGG